jgi:tetratricopeptide (TPR) repeat protein
LHVAVWAAQLLALGAKESAAILPAMLLLVDLWPRDGVPLRERWRELVRLHAPAWLLGGAAAAFLLTRDVPDVEISRWVYLATQMKVIWSYLAMMVAPSMVSTVYDVVPARLGDGFVWLAGLALLSLLASTVWLYRRWPFVALALWWATLALAPTSTLIPIPLLEDEDRTYLAFLPLWVLPAHALLWLGDVRPRLSRWLVRAGGSLVLLLLLGLTLARGVLWSDRELLWYEASKRHPDSVVAAGYYCLALLGRSDRAAPALSHCTRAQQRFPENQTLQLGVIRAYVGVGDIAKAEAALARFLAMGKPSHQILRMAGHLAWFRNRPAEAIDYYRRLLKLQPFDLEAVLYMARCYAELGSMAEARSLAGELDRWATPLARDFRITLAELHRTIGWTQRACREFEMLRADSHGRHAASPEWQRLSSACTTH